MDPTNTPTITLIHITPEEWGKNAEKLEITYSVHETHLGNIMIASTARGVCFIGFADDHTHTFTDLRSRFPGAQLIERTMPLHENVLGIIKQKKKTIETLPLHIHGTEFQIKIWEALLTIPRGMTSSYGALAKKIGKPKASRAVGTAVGANPISILIPCHRVLPSNGTLGNYHWGPQKKKALLLWEGAHTEKNKD